VNYLLELTTLIEHVNQKLSLTSNERDSQDVS
jgi:hypothetical protein